MRKTIKLLMVAILITIFLLTSCTKAGKPPNTYKGLNGETITDLGVYGAERIIESENFTYPMHYEATEIDYELENTKLYVIVIWSTEQEEVAVMVWSYMYGWNEHGTVDDTWEKKTVIKEW